MTRAESGGLSALRHEAGRGLAATDCLGVDVRPRLESVVVGQGPHPVSIVEIRTFRWMSGVAAEAGATEPAKMPVASRAPAALRATRLTLLIDDVLPDGDRAGDAAGPPS